MKYSFGDHLAFLFFDLCPIFVTSLVALLYFIDMRHLATTVLATFYYPIGLHHFIYLFLSLFLSNPRK